jgi:porin
MTGRHGARCLVIALIVVSAATAEASPRAGQSATPAPSPAAAAAPNVAAADGLWQRWAKKKKSIEDAGLKIDFEWSQVLQDMLRGEAHEDAPYGGKLDLLLTADLSKIGLWRGLSVTAQPMYNYGDFLNGAGGTLTPIYDAAIYPGETGGDRFDLMSLYLTQRFHSGVSLTLGKINLIEGARGYPIRGGAGVDAFWNCNLSTTITGLASPAIFGATLVVPAGQWSFGINVYDAVNAMNHNVFDKPFVEGVTFMNTATLTATTGGHTGYFGLRGIYTTESHFDLDDFEYLFLPPGFPEEFATLEGDWLASAQVEQYLVGGPGGKGRSLGVFAEVVAVDGNPLPFQYSWQLGVAGDGLFKGRPQDRWGVAAFGFNLSTVLKQNFPDLNKFNDEHGVEMFYNWKVTPWLRATADLQFIDPSYSTQRAIFAGISTNVRF